MITDDRTLKTFYESIDFSKPMVLVSGERYGMSLYGVVQALKIYKGCREQLNVSI